MKKRMRRRSVVRSEVSVKDWRPPVDCRSCGARSDRDEIAHWRGLCEHCVEEREEEKELEGLLAWPDLDESLERGFDMLGTDRQYGDGRPFLHEDAEVLPFRSRE